MGNPLLDVSAVTDPSFLSKYGVSGMTLDSSNLIAFADRNNAHELRVNTVGGQQPNIGRGEAPTHVQGMLPVQLSAHFRLYPKRCTHPL